MMHQAALTPIERLPHHLWVKRDDHYTIGDSAGGKVRTCWYLATRPGVRGLVTAGSRHSPQVNIVATVAAHLGIPCAVHIPYGPTTPEITAAIDAGAQVYRHDPGHNTVIVHRARTHAAKLADLGWVEIPFGMECSAAIEMTVGQVPRRLPRGVERIVVPVGSGMSAAGILTGLERHGHTLPVLGVTVGADPTARLDRWAPVFWRTQLELVQPGIPYHRAVAGDLHGNRVDPIYEAKCLPYLRPGDLFWIVGRRGSVAP